MLRYWYVSIVLHFCDSLVLSTPLKGKAEVCTLDACMTSTKQLNVIYSIQFLNPGGSVKDRVALRGELQRHVHIFI